MLKIQIDTIELPAVKIEAIAADAVKTAEAVNLIYVNDSEPGITRVKKGERFLYYLGNKKLSDKLLLERIKRLVIPPAWDNVWICSKENGHLQATGFDLKKRKQYRYHPLWNSLRNHTKFYRMIDFGKHLPVMRKKIEEDLNLPGLPQAKVLALVVTLMEQTNIRIGNAMYEKLYGSYGLTTLKDKHVHFSGSSMRFTFKGKKGVHHAISIKSRKLANLVKKCQDIPGKELFQYFDENDAHHSVDSGMVNDYIKHISGRDFTAKDFRTWSGTMHALLAFKMIGCGETQTATKKRIVEVLDLVSQKLGNTRTVCKKYYVHPVLVTLFENRRLEKYFNELEKMNAGGTEPGLTCEEKVLLKLLKKESLTI